MTEERRCITVPNEKMPAGTSVRNAAVFCTASGGGDCQSSPFHVVVTFTSHGRVFGAWGDLISTPVASPCELYEGPLHLLGKPCLEHDGLGLAFIKDFSLHLPEVADDGASNWIPRRAIELGKFMPPPRVLSGSRIRVMSVSISGFSEDGNVANSVRQKVEVSIRLFISRTDL
ncbi:hypothetical protein E2562_019877 [Oryza meyeriana var. granulata]|uniref:Uncharacterized protein n=1 Tax=Oryza meyeriana var. granulata TaxID=110450 RepID=A0A6G1EXD6_9ORYZ|nr:hypothetical protein E2562_019877 [Oryza meyeriana var. granulata]